MYTLRQNFLLAANDYRYLLNHEYQPAGILDLVGNRHELSSAERSMLYRGIFSQKICQKRRERIIPVEELAQNEPIFVDGFNVIITISAYLQGLPVFIAADGMLRDAAYARGKIEQIQKLNDAAGMLADSLLMFSNVKSEIYFDRKVEKNAELIHRMNEALLSKKENFQILALDNVDQSLISKTNGIICTSDSGIIDKAACRIFDLARHTLESAFRPKFPDMNKLTEDL